jgi:hypothetical protein
MTVYYSVVECEVGLDMKPSPTIAADAVQENEPRSRTANPVEKPRAVG